MEKTREGLIDFVAALAQKVWGEGTTTPLYLSDVSPALTREGIDYREIIGSETTLKRFLHENANGKFRVVTDPWKKAKVGLVPPDIQFEFSALQSPKEGERHYSDKSRTTLFSKKRAAFDFLRALAELEDTDVDKIVIPTSVLIKLFVDR